MQTVDPCVSNYGLGKSVADASNRGIPRPRVVEAG